MSKRKKYIINKKFQLKTTFTIIGFIFVIVALMTIIIGINALDVNSKIQRIVEIEDNIVQVLTIADTSSDDQTQRMSIEMARNHNENMQTLRSMIKKNQILLWSIIAIIFIQGVVLFFVLIRQTHRIAGPLYVMTIYMNQIINGKYPEFMRPLRDRDLLKDFYDTFKQMVETTKAGKVKK